MKRYFAIAFFFAALFAPIAQADSFYPLSYGPTRAHETLVDIAKIYAESTEYSVEQWTVVLWEHNPSAFSEDNLHKLKHKALLSAPRDENLRVPSQQDALAIIHKHLTLTKINASATQKASRTQHTDSPPVLHSPSEAPAQTQLPQGTTSTNPPIHTTHMLPHQEALPLPKASLDHAISPSHADQAPRSPEKTHKVLQKSLAQAYPAHSSENAQAPHSHNAQSGTTSQDLPSAPHAHTPQEYAETSTDLPALPPLAHTSNENEQANLTDTAQGQNASHPLPHSELEATSAQKMAFQNPSPTQSISTTPSSPLFSQRSSKKLPVPVASKALSEMQPNLLIYLTNTLQTLRAYVLQSFQAQLVPMTLEHPHSFVFTYAAYLPSVSFDTQTKAVLFILFGTGLFLSALRAIYHSAYKKKRSNDTAHSKDTPLPQTTSCPARTLYTTTEITDFDVFESEDGPALKHHLAKAYARKKHK